MGIFKAFEMKDKAKLYGQGNFEETYNNIIDKSICNTSYIKDGIKYITISNFVKEVYAAIKKNIDFPYGIYYEEVSDGVTNTVLIRYGDIKTIFNAYTTKYNSEQEAEKSLKAMFLGNSIDDLAKSLDNIMEVTADANLYSNNENNDGSNFLDDLFEKKDLRLEEISVCVIEGLSRFKDTSKTIRNANISHIKNIIKKYIEFRKTSNEIPVFSKDEEQIVNTMVNDFKKDKYDLDSVIESGIRFILYALDTDKNIIETASFFGFIIEAIVRYQNNSNSFNNDSSIIDEVMRILKGGI